MNLFSSLPVGEQIKMAVFVFSAFLVLVVVASAAPAEKSILIPRIDDHNLVKCKEQDPATPWKRLHSDEVEAKGKLLQVVERTFKYPTDGAGDYTITCIRVSDLIHDGTGGYPTIQSGGLDFTDVTIHFTSQRSHGFKFSVDIYGVKP